MEMAMRTYFRMLAVLAGFAASASQASAQAKPTTTAAPPPSQQGSLSAAAKEYSFEIRPTIGIAFPLSPSGDVGWDIGGSLRAKPPTWPFGVQLDMLLLDMASTVFQFTLDGVFTFSSSSKAFQPYVIAGLGLYDGNFGINAGAGADFAIKGSPIGFFADARFNLIFASGPDQSILPINAGVRVRF
jgi:hypothetical protein